MIVELQSCIFCWSNRNAEVSMVDFRPNLPLPLVHTTLQIIAGSQVIVPSDSTVKHLLIQSSFNNLSGIESQVSVGGRLWRRQKGP